MLEQLKIGKGRTDQPSNYPSQSTSLSVRIDWRGNAKDNPIEPHVTDNDDADVDDKVEDEIVTQVLWGLLT